MIDKELLAEDIRHINELKEELQRYLYGECDCWVLNNFENGLEIVAIMERYNHENGMVHCYLRNKISGCCYDVRGEFGCDTDVLRYTEVDYEESNIEEFVFEELNDFKKYLRWVDFEQVRDLFQR